tara:strand:+ start:113 stop:304 length:192 start_codon:yes stop_codon:yes gene_type:complete
MAKKRYILTIEFNTSEDRCEYIEERLLTDSEDDRVLTIGYIDLGDYFNESDLNCVMEHNIGVS